jgi:hypothetical protein
VTQIPSTPSRPIHGPAKPPVRSATGHLDGNTAAPDPRAIERNEYARLWNAVSDALTAFCERNNHPRPRFSERNLTAAHVWRTLHPGSRFGVIAERPTDDQ